MNRHYKYKWAEDSQCDKLRAFQWEHVYDPLVIARAIKSSNTDEFDELMLHTRQLEDELPDGHPVRQKRSVSRKVKHMCSRASRITCGFSKTEQRDHCFVVKCFPTFEGSGIALVCATSDVTESNWWPPSQLQLQQPPWIQTIVKPKLVKCAVVVPCGADDAAPLTMLELPESVHQYMRHLRKLPDAERKQTPMTQNKLTTLIDEDEFCLQLLDASSTLPKGAAVFQFQPVDYFSCPCKTCNKN